MEDRLQHNKADFKLKTVPSPARSMTLQELAFLIHFIGDIHQPLHAAVDGDRGGNCVNLTIPLTHSDGSRDTTELHAVWDVDEVMSVFKALGTEDATFKSALTQEVQRTGLLCHQLTPVDWAKGSPNDLARKDTGPLTFQILQA